MTKRTLDRLSLRGMRFDCIVGLFDFERNTPQPVELDVTLHFDTREAAFGNVELGPGQAEPWSFADFVASVNIGGVAVGNQMAVIGNLTSASLRRQYASQAASSYVSVFPDQLPTGQRPATSNLNMVENVPVPNLAVVKYGASSTAWVYNFNGYAHYLFDASAVVLAD